MIICTEVTDVKWVQQEYLDHGAVLSFKYDTHMCPSQSKVLAIILFFTITGMERKS